MVEDECVVCYEMTTDRVVPCNHTICASCARSWFTRRIVCPLCLQLPCKLVTSDGGDETDVFFDRPPIGVTVTTRSNEVIVKAVQRKRVLYNEIERFMTQYTPTHGAGRSATQHKWCRGPPRPAVQNVTVLQNSLLDY